MDYSFLHYTFLDPTHNYTILCESEVPEEKQPEAAAFLMEKEPLCEQVGFWKALRPAALRDEASSLLPHAALRMAGGEFCGNAAMASAALYCEKYGLPENGTVKVAVSGMEAYTAVDMEKTEAGAYRGTVHMPAPVGIEECTLEADGRLYTLPLIRFPGISHLICTEEPQPDRGPAAAIRAWCRTLAAEGLGIMFLDITKNRMTPLVYIPGSDTLFWENSCASGTAAAGACLAAKAGKPVTAAIEEPGGTLTVEAAPEGCILLTGTVKAVYSFNPSDNP